MKNWLIDFLCCPVCGGNLTVKSFEASDKEILNGLLLCGCQRWYPIINGLPRVLWGEHRDDYLEFISNYEPDLSKYSINLELSGRITTKKKVLDTYTTIWDNFPRFGIDGKDKEKFYDKWMSQYWALRRENTIFKGSYTTISSSVFTMRHLHLMRII